MESYILFPKHTQQILCQRKARPMREALQEVKASQASPDNEDAVVLQEALHTAERAGDVERDERSAEQFGVAIAQLSPEAVAAIQPKVHTLLNRPVQLMNPLTKTALNAGQKPSTANLWHLERLGIWDDQGRRRAQLTGSGVTVGVFDTGVDTSHAELSSRVSRGVYTQDGVVIDESVTQPQWDTEGHGTHVAGLIGGQHIGIAPEAKLVSVRVLNGDTGDLADIVFWLKQAPALGAAIINLSIGIPADYTTRNDWLVLEALMDEVSAQGTLPVVAIGNEGNNTARVPGLLRNVVSVGACRQDNYVAGFSGSARMDHVAIPYQVPRLVAPGHQVCSCVMGGGYEIWDGTSMATPLISGLAALLLEKDPDLSAQDLADRLDALCAPIHGPTHRQGSGCPRFP